VNELIVYFENIPSAHRTIILVGGLLFFWIIEGILPIVKFKYSKFKHALSNLFFTLTTAIINLGFAFLIIKSSDWVTANDFGLVNWVPMPFWLTLLVGLLFMDLIGAYFIHWIEHQIGWMWKFHVIHHSDTKVDATTALRHHPGESIFRAAFTMLAVLLVGAPIWLLMLYQSLSAFLSQFNHSNIRLNPKLDKLLSYVIITPGMHRIHHHFEQPLTDKNYGNIFGLWDRVFGTYRYVPQEDLVFGLDVFDKNEANLNDLLKLPFSNKTYTNK